MRQISALVVSVLVAGSVSAATLPADSYVLCDSDVTYMLGKGISSGDLKVLQTRFGDHFLWARRAGARYVIRDEVWLQKARDVLQRNVQAGPERDARVADVIDRAVKVGKAERLP